MPKLKALGGFPLPSVNLRCKRKIFLVTIAHDNYWEADKFTIEYDRESHRVGIARQLNESNLSV